MRLRRRRCRGLPRPGGPHLLAGLGLAAGRGAELFLAGVLAGVVLAGGPGLPPRACSGPPPGGGAPAAADARAPVPGARAGAAPSAGGGGAPPPFVIPPASPIRLSDVTARTGIDFRHTDGSSGRRYIVETVSCGLALFDYDNDGDSDIYFLNGAPLPGSRARTRPCNHLCRNDGAFHFTDVTSQAGVGDTGYGLGVAAADYDNDGDIDLYVSNHGPNVLYRNEGNGMFTDVTSEAGVGGGDRVGAGVCFLDIEGDGDLDLYVGNYVDFSYEKKAERRISGIPVYPGPMWYGPVPDVLYRNEGDGTFTDVSASSGIGAHAGTTMGVICADYDGDGDTDIFAGNDAQGNFLFRNEGEGRFCEVGLAAGVAYDAHGEGQGTMGVEAADFDNDGLLDFHATSYENQLPTLYRNLGGGLFEDVTRPSRAGEGMLADVTWGNGLVDLDNDGRRDLFIACGHLQDNVELYNDVCSYRARNRVLRNVGGGGFVDVSRSAGEGLAVELSSRGAAFDDLDGDGDIDVVIVNSRREPTILRNDSPARHHWIEVRLRGVRANRDGVGSRVRVVAGDLVQVDEVHSGRGYQSHYGLRLHFGLGGHERVDRVEVRWIGGGRQVLEDVAADQALVIRQEEGGAGGGR